MPIVDTWDGENRLIYLHADTLNVDWEMMDLYREYRNHRRLSESFRLWEPLLAVADRVAKGGGKFTPRFMTLLNGTKIIPHDANGECRPQGEILTDDASSPWKTDTLANNVIIIPFAAEAEVIEVQTGGTAVDDIWGYTGP